MLLCIAALGFAEGCSDTVSPQAPISDGFTFLPTAPEQKVADGSFLDFKVSHLPETDLGVRWWVNGEPSGVGPRYRFFPTTTRIDTVMAEASRPGKASRRIWYVNSMYNSPTAIAFTPPGTIMDVVIGDTCRFTASSSRAAATDFRWEFGERESGSDAHFFLVPTKAGTESLKATVSAPDRVVSRSWQIRTYGAEELPPAPPTALQYHVLEGIANIVISWQQSAVRGGDIASYELAVSYDGPIDDNNWSRARVLIERPFDSDQVAYVDTLSADNGLLVAGAHAWLAATSINVFGVRSTVSNSIELDITEPWWATGTVRDETGKLLPDITIWDAGHHISATTGVDGRYRIGPFPDDRRIWLESESPNADVPDNAGAAWFDSRSDTLAMGEREDWDFLLLSDAGMVSNCDAYDGGFLEFLRDLTRTMNPSLLRPNVNLYKWDTYPVPVWVPDYTSETGIDYGALCRETIRIWNDTMGEEYLTIVPDSTGAGISFRYGDDNPGFMGRAILIEDSFTGHVLGDVVPEHVEVYLLKDLPNIQLATEVALHELGHALGLVGHASCWDQGYLMDISPVGALSNGEENAIHPDEVRALRAVRNLPQGTDMGQFILNLW